MVVVGIKPMRLLLLTSRSKVVGMLTKHYLPRAYMNYRKNESLLTDFFALPVQFGYALFWDFWHKSSFVSTLDTGKINMQNLLFYKKNKMNEKDRKKANEITLAIYESLIKSNLYTITSKEKQYYSCVYDRYFEYVDLPRVLVQVHADESLKNKQEVRIQFDANQAKSIENDKYLTILNQSLAKIDDNLTALTPVNQKGWYVYQLKDDSLNYRIDLINDFEVDDDPFTIHLDHEHTWNLAKQYGALFTGSSGTGKTGLLFGLIYLLMQKNKQNQKNDKQNKISIYIADGKNDELGNVMAQILPEGHVVTGTDTVNLVHEMVQKTDQRYADMAKERKKNPQMAFANFDKFGFDLTVIIIDEQSSVTASLSSSKAKKQYQNDLLRLVQTSRGAGIVPVIAMQQANSLSFGGTLGTAIREQITGLKVIMGNPATITTQDKQMVFGTGVELPPTRFDQVGSGYLQTASMPNPEPFQAPLLPSKSEDLYKLLKHNS